MVSFLTQVSGGAPALFFDVENQNDHKWYDFENVEITEEPP